MLAELIKNNRSCRRFDESHQVAPETLRELIDLARCSASAANRQPLKYIPSTNPDKNEEIFACLGWAAYLKNWPGPVPGERPAAYIIISGDTRIATNFWCDHGIASQSILLGAREMGLAGCIFGAINTPKLKKTCGLPNELEVLLVLAIGKPAEKIVLEQVGPDGDIKYWRDEQQVHHVPKRPLEEIIVTSFN
ncbi:MAG: nitroreductase family protein [Desulfobacterales bacterium]|nr:nitroreductase family protein [Desulfobacterales bacterium]